jgi:hypothetical protein
MDKLVVVCKFCGTKNIIDKEIFNCATCGKVQELCIDSADKAIEYKAPCKKIPRFVKKVSVVEESETEVSEMLTLTTDNNLDIIKDND